MKPQMYDELVSALRNNADHYGFVGNNGLVHLLTNAADAIEELEKQVNKNNNWWAAAKMLMDMVMSLPKWIPVAERLPEKEGKFLVCGQWRGKPMQIWICERVKLGPVFGWANRAENPVISHWMPLPEPPKEETE